MMLCRVKFAEGKPRGYPVMISLCEIILRDVDNYNKCRISYIMRHSSSREKGLFKALLLYASLLVISFDEADRIFPI